MALKQWLIGTAGALAFTAMVGPVKADPLGGAVSHFNSPSTMTKQVAYQLCATEGGVRRCRWVNLYGPRAYGYQAPTSAIAPMVYRYRPASEYSSTLPNDYFVGTPQWWRNMDRQERGGSGK